MISSRSVCDRFGLVAGTSVTDDAIGLEPGKAEADLMGLWVVATRFVTFFLVTREKGIRRVSFPQTAQADADSSQLRFILET